MLVIMARVFPFESMVRLKIILHNAEIAQLNNKHRCHKIKKKSHSFVKLRSLNCEILMQIFTVSKFLYYLQSKKRKMFAENDKLRK